jgi:hypothetical protein
VGTAVGWVVGSPDGTEDDKLVGSKDGWLDGCPVGIPEGCPLGAVGIDDTEGCALGLPDGLALGAELMEGCVEGSAEG